MIGQAKFYAVAPVLAILTTLAISPSFFVRGGQYDRKCNVTFAFLWHATLVADEIWTIMLPPARKQS